MVIGWLVNGTTYQVRLRAVNAAGPGDSSPAVAVTPNASSSVKTTVVGWGSNGGQLGDGTTNDSPAPVGVSASGALAGKRVLKVSVGSGHACGVTSDGGAYCWGSNQNGQLET